MCAYFFDEETGTARLDTFQGHRAREQNSQRSFYSPLPPFPLNCTPHEVEERSHLLYLLMWTQRSANARYSVHTC